MPDVVEMYSGTLESAQRLLDSGSKLIRQAQDEIVSMMETADASADGLTSAAEDIAAAQGKLEEALSSAQASFDELRALIDSSGLSQLLDPEVVQRIDQLAASAQANIQAARKDYNENLKPDLDRPYRRGKGSGCRCIPGHQRHEGSGNGFRRRRTPLRAYWAMPSRRSAR